MKKYIYFYINNGYLCPVCGYSLNFKPWDGDSPSNDICSCCGIEFGYYDLFWDINKRQKRYKELRQKWINDGMKWWSSCLPPKNWDPKIQLEKLLILEKQNKNSSN